MSRPASEPELDETVRCGQCRHELTHRRYTIAVEGAHQHTFRNPHGWSFQVACFSTAPGVAAFGPPVAEHTWFEGFQWQVALCDGCGGHIGWWYLGASTFVGLIVTRLR